MGGCLPIGITTTMLGISIASSITYRSRPVGNFASLLSLRLCSSSVPWAQCTRPRRARTCPGSSKIIGGRQVGVLPLPVSVELNVLSPREGTGITAQRGQERTYSGEEVTVTT